MSVIVPVYNNPDGVQVLLRSLAAQEGPLPPFEVVLSDNGSYPPLRRAAHDGLQVRLVQEPVPGRGRARNAALRVARGDVLAFIDSDCVAAPDWLRTGLARVEAHPDAGQVAGRVEVTVRDPSRPTTAEYYESLVAFNMERNVRRSRFGGTGNLFVRRAVVEQVGPLDDQLQSAEDMEWGQRIHAAGFPLVYAPEVVVAHAARTSFRQLARKMRRTTGGLVQLRRQREGRWRLSRALLAPFAVVWRLLYVLAIPPYTLVRLVQQRRLTRRGKALPLLILMWGLQAVKAYELTRLALGGRPIR